MLLHKNWMTRFGAGAALSLGAISLVGCSTTGPETGTDVEDVQEDAEDAEEQVDEQAEEQAESGYDGLYDQAFYDDVDSLDGETVTVSANVNEIISENGFTIAGTDETTVDELLILHEGDYPELEPGLTVAVTGTVHHVFTIEDVESDGFGLDEQVYADWENTPYIEATGIDLSVPAEPEDADDTSGEDATDEPDAG